MDKEFEYNINDKHFVKYLKLLLLGLLALIEILICVQYIGYYIENGGTAQLILLIASSFLLFVFVTVDSFAITKIAFKFVFFGFDSLFLLAICLITGNSYL